MVDRGKLRRAIEQRLRESPIVALLGPRQCGKTTLAREIGADRNAIYFDLEDPRSAARLAEPMTTLAPLRGLVVIDEVQHAPALFPVLRVLADRPRRPARFLLLGSASAPLAADTAESLAGRVAFVEMSGFTLDELGPASMRRLWLRGGFPRAYLARGDAASARWREDFVRTFLERDLPRLGTRTPAATYRRFWTMLAHTHGNLLNASDIGRSLGESHTTIRRHLDTLCGALVVRQLAPWFENLAKRQVRAPKVYIRDTGLLHTLLGLESFAMLEGHPKLGASFEGFVVEHVVTRVGERNAFFWATPAGAELDLLVHLGSRRIGIEIKYADAPRITRSMHVALEDLGLERLFVVTPAGEPYPLGERVEVCPLPQLLAWLDAHARGRPG
jgi:predicted AAA+ superfamily ATPase